MKHQKIWDKVLAEHEQVKYEFSISDRYRYWGMVTMIIFGALISAIWNPTVGVIFILIMIFNLGFYMKVAYAYAFTDKQVIMHVGWLNTKMTTVDYHKITDVTVEETFFGKHLYHCGNLSIDTAGRGDQEIILKNISSPYELKKKLDELRKKT